MCIPSETMAYLIRMKCLCVVEGKQKIVHFKLS
jgi:hypothetical protein